MAASPDITFVTVCKGRLAHLQESLPTFMAQPKSHVIVVDVDCPDGTAKWLATHHPKVEVCQLQAQGPFNLSQARNAGLALVKTPWVCFVDADVVLAKNFVAQTKGKRATNQFFTFKNTVEKFGIAGTVIAETAAVRKFGGYDEAIVGYGGEDYDLYDSLLRSGCQQIFLDDTIIAAVLQHSKAARTDFYDIKDTRFSIVVNGFYRILKKHVRNTDPTIDFNLPQKRKIYDEALRAVNMAEQSGQKTVELEIPLPPDPIMYQPYASLAQTLKLHLKLNFER